MVTSEKLRSQGVPGASHLSLFLADFWNGKALARQALWRHLVLIGLVQSKPSGLAQACSRQAQAALDGATGHV